MIATLLFACRPMDEVPPPELHTATRDTGDPSCVPGAEVVGNGVDEDCDGHDGTATRARSTARTIITGHESSTHLGASVACASWRVGTFAAAAAFGAPETNKGEFSGPGMVGVVGPEPLGDLGLLEVPYRLFVNNTQSPPNSLGQAVAFTHDTDGDGRGELLADSPPSYQDVPGTDIDTHTGAVWRRVPHEGAVERVRDAEVMITAEPGSMVGGGRSLGDLDGDGLDEVLAARTTWNYRSEPGEVMVFRGSDLRRLTLPEHATRRIESLDPATPTGMSAVTGDFDGDGVLDLALGEYEWEERGRVVVVAGPLLERPTYSDIVVEGEREGTDLLDSPSTGSHLAAGDLNGDGFDDLVVGAHTRDSTGDRSGRAAVFFGPLAGTVSVDTADILIDGEGEYAWLGAGLAILDHDGDGLPDLAVGAPSDPYFGPPRPGLVYVFHGPLSAGDLDPRSADRVLVGTDPYELFGWELAGCDLDGDGRDELVVGAPGNAAGMISAGRGYVIDPHR